MRIISGFTDYYDYIANQHVDNRIVYNRHCQEYTPDYDDKRRVPTYRLIGRHDPDVADTLRFPEHYYDVDSVHFCGKRYFFIVNEGRITFEPNEMYALLAAELRRKGKRQYAFDNLREMAKRFYEPVASSLNQELNAPVVLECKLPSGSAYITNIRLRTMQFVQVFAPEQAFMNLYNFLIPKEIEPDRDPDNMARYEAKGFDKTISFRKRK